MRTLLTFLFLVSFVTVFSQEAPEEETSSFEVSGSVDAYYRANLSGPNTAFEDGSFLNPGTSFANRSGFSLGMANVVLSYEGSKVGFVADLVFGPRGEDAVFLSVGSSNIVNQLYAYWNVSESVTLTLGNFNTFLGYEVISPTGNFNYSTSYMFSNGPFSHTGLKSDFALSDDFSLMLAIMNSTDFTEVNFDGSYTLGAQLGYKDQFLNLVYGEQTGTSGTTFQSDYTGGADLSDDFFSIKPRITITSPNGGEAWTIGTTQNITWTSSGLTGNLIIVLQQNGINAALLAKNVDPVSGSYTWTVGDCLKGNVAPGTNYKILILDRSSSTKDRSNADFTIN